MTSYKEIEKCLNRKRVNLSVNTNIWAKLAQLLMSMLLWVSSEEPLISLMMKNIKVDNHQFISRLICANNALFLQKWDAPVLKPCKISFIAIDYKHINPVSKLKDSIYKPSSSDEAIENSLDIIIPI